MHGGTNAWCVRSELEAMDYRSAGGGDGEDAGVSEAHDYIYIVSARNALEERDGIGKLKQEGGWV